MIDGRVLATSQRYCKSKRRWEPEQVIARADGSDRIQVPLSKDGELWLYPDMISQEMASTVTKDLLACPSLFRSYRVQGILNEPRLQAHFHERATVDYNLVQPGYRYGATTLKARPLSMIPSLESLARRAIEISGVVDSWQIGATVVLYRNGNDHLGQHSDDDQGESYILTAVIDARKAYVWKITIMEKTNETRLRDGATKIHLLLRQGDGYSMDGKMQTNHTHGVTSSKIESSESTRRMSVVFRDGRLVQYEKDSGSNSENMKRQLSFKARTFGHIENLTEGSIYSREELLTMKAHGGFQRGISGNQTVGCDAIIVSGTYWGHDDMVNLYYTVTDKVGGKALKVSAQRHLPIRVFRSSTYLHNFRAVVPPHFPQSSCCYYRYDGLYWSRIPKTTEVERTTSEKEDEEVIHLVRIDGWHEPIKEYRNTIENSGYLRYCSKDRKTLRYYHD